MTDRQINSDGQSVFHGLRFMPAQRIIVLIVSLCLFTILGSAVIGIVMRGGVTAQSLRVSTVLQDCIIFILPAVVSALLISPYAARFLGVDRGFDIRLLLLAVVTMMVSVPAMNALVELNDGMVLPSALSGLEKWMREAEEQARASVETLLGGPGFGSLAVNLLIVGVLAGLSEEIFFRGALQRILLSCKVGHHVAIWATAFVFSAFHMQFFGFFPRLILGAYFGYLFYWSKSLWLPVVMHAFNNSLVVYAMWREKSESLPAGSGSINDWGADSPVLIVLSVILTAVGVWFLSTEAKRLGDGGRTSSRPEC